MISTRQNKLHKGLQSFPVKRVSGNHFNSDLDTVIKEAPLEISIACGPMDNRRKELLSVTMRTPGDDFNMVTGFLFAEHFIHKAADILSIRFTGNFEEETLQENALLVELAPEVKIDLSTGKKFITSSACGFCGSSAFDVSAHEGTYIPIVNNEMISVETLYQLPATIQSFQGLF
ncbi:MAG: formate dehydrogenase accessory sulfurtransferase FdhD, partial [Chitinophagales bacterium]